MRQGEGEAPGQLSVGCEALGQTGRLGLLAEQLEPWEGVPSFPPTWRPAIRTHFW